MTVDLDAMKKKVFAHACERCTREGLDAKFTKEDFREAHPDMAPGHVDLAVSILAKENALHERGSGTEYSVHVDAYEEHVNEEE